MQSCLRWKILPRLHIALQIRQYGLRAALNDVRGRLLDSILVAYDVDQSTTRRHLHRQPIEQPIAAHVQHTKTGQPGDGPNVLQLVVRAVEELEPMQMVQVDGQVCDAIVLDMQFLSDGRTMRQLSNDLVVCK